LYASGWVFPKRLIDENGVDGTVISSTSYMHNNEVDGGIVGSRLGVPSKQRTHWG
jgi:hypothetical protein